MLTCYKWFKTKLLPSAIKRLPWDAIILFLGPLNNLEFLLRPIRSKNFAAFFKEMMVFDLLRRNFSDLHTVLDG